MGQRRVWPQLRAMPTDEDSCCRGEKGRAGISAGGGWPFADRTSCRHLRRGKAGACAAAGRMESRRVLLLCDGNDGGEMEGRLRRQRFGDHASEFLAVYPGDNDEQAVRSAIDYGSDTFIAFGTWKWIEAQVKTGDAPVYRYHLRTGRAAEQVSSRLVCFSLRRHRVCFWDAGHAARGSVAAGRSQTERRDDGLLDELCQDRRSRTGRDCRNGRGSTRPANVIHLDSTITASPDTTQARYEFLLRIRTPER